MPRSYPPARVHVAFRLSPTGVAAVDRIARAEHPVTRPDGTVKGDRSAALRALIGEALAARGTRPAAPAQQAGTDGPPAADDLDGIC